jgi:four helix bundle protein
MNQLWSNGSGGGVDRSSCDCVQMQDHRKLRVWRLAQDLSISVRRATRQLPRTGFGSLKAQMTNAAESVVLNIAEGCGATSQREFARFLDICIKSSVELEAQLELAKDYGVMSVAKWTALTSLVIDVRRMLCGLRSKVLSVDTETRRPTPQDTKSKRQTVRIVE